MATRKVVQIAATQSRMTGTSTLVVLCADGALLEFAPQSNPPWKAFPEIPGPEIELQRVWTFEPLPPVPPYPGELSDDEEHA